tara:strand:- start:112043 stop:113269 length:1227 start_codon:yes stop_codon:yes gene_type:complete
MLKKLLLLIVGFSFTASLALAADEPVSFANFLIQSDQPLPSTQQEELMFNYNSKNFDGGLLDKYSKAELMEMIRTNSNPDIEKGTKLTSLTIPFGPKVNWGVIERDDNDSGSKSRLALINEFKKYKLQFSKESVEAINSGLENLTEAELRTFLSKKHAFLTGIAGSMEKMFLRFKVKPPYKMIQGLVNSLNGVFYQKSEQFVRSNTFGMNSYVVAGAGATLGKIIYDFVISKTPLKRWISPNFGFYLGTSFGFGISRVRVDDKSAWMLDLFFDFESLKRAFAPILEVYGGAGFGFYMEARELPAAGKRIFTSSGAYKNTFYAPFIGTNRMGPASLSNQHTVNLSLPFPSSFFETNMSRRYLHIVLKKSYADGGLDPKIKARFFEALASFFKTKPTSVQNACMGFYKFL